MARDFKHHQDNPDIIKSSVGAISDNKKWIQSEAAELCAGDSWFTEGCTRSDAMAWLKAIKRYHNDVFLEAVGNFESALDQHEISGGSVKQRRALQQAAQISELYDSRIDEIADIEDGFWTNKEYYTGRVREIVSLWDELARGHDILMANLPAQVDPSDLAGEPGPNDPGQSGGGSGLNWGTVAIVAGVSGLIFVGVKLWNE